MFYGGYLRLQKKKVYERNPQLICNLFIYALGETQQKTPANQMPHFAQTEMCHRLHSLLLGGTV